MIFITGSRTELANVGPSTANLIGGEGNKEREMNKLYNEKGLYAQVKSDAGYSGQNAVLKSALAIIATIALVGLAIYIL